MATIFAETFISEPVKLLQHKIASGEFVDFFRSAKLDYALLERLNITLLRLQAVLNDAEQKQITNSAVKKWLVMLQDVVFDAEHLFDQINTEGLRCRVEAEYQGNSVSAEYKRTINSKMQTLLERLEYFAKQAHLLGLREGVSSSVWHGTPTSFVAVDESAIYGRDDERSEDSVELEDLLGSRGVHTSTSVSQFLQILKWVYENNKTWRIVGLMSSVVGLSCFALSPSFNSLIRGWKAWKFFLYGVFSLVVLTTILFVKPSPFFSRYVRYKITGFLVLMLITVYNFYYDKAVNGKPEILSLVSNVAFALMSLSLSKLMKYGHEMGIFSFFLSCLTVQLWMINWKLILVSIFFGSPLFVMHSSSDPEHSSSDSRQDQPLEDMETGAKLAQGTH